MRFFWQVDTNVVLLWVLILFFPEVVCGMEWTYFGWRLDPTFSLNEEFNDNPRLSFEQKDAGFITTISPGLLIGRREERWEVNLGATLNYDIYNGVDIPDRDSERIRLRSHLYFTERAFFQLNGSYVRDTLLRRVFIEIDEDFLEPIEDIDIGLVDVSTRRNRVQINPSWRYALTERTSLQLEYGFTDLSYAESEEINLINTQQHLLSGKGFYELTPISTLSLNVNATRRTSEDESETDNLEALVGWNHLFSETLQGEARAGYRITSASSNDEEETSNGFVGELTIQYLTEVGSLRGTISRTVTPSGNGRSNQTDRIRIQYTQEVMPRLSFVLRGDAFRTEPVEDDFSQGERRYFDVEPRLLWNWTRWWAVEAGYHYRRRENESPSESASSNAVFVAITYTPLIER
ncbi:outer membrane beta-barrel protein [Nitrosococcus wardiae]|uniref:TIGR03016 family PEP-CTERM system-associated outer membrane protein n=1 Tax=Nitrosococcus wardiae TaxID=1814290 RepID=A0A4P7BYQ8_9GAMM|nr:outer membrane beta-barrel protein [Nitrosococcus wardiae]QBQ54379.1 hypothetical protein E3U44_07540 [Nitrosococcus wardiae]